MSHQHLTPVATQERIHTIDIIRGFALCGILIVNFKNIISNNSVPGQWPHPADTSVEWFISFFMNDKFWPIYNFMFGLGFALQLQRAVERNTPFAWIHLRRMIVLYLIGAAQVILTGDSVVQDYAMIGVLLLLFWKVPYRFLPWIAIVLMLISITRNEIERWEKREKMEIAGAVKMDTAILNKYVGVYKDEFVDQVAIVREDSSIFFEGPFGKNLLYAQSDSDFFIKERSIRFTFRKDSSGKINQLIIQPPNRLIIDTRIEMDIKEAVQRITKRRTSPNIQSRPSTYAEYVNQRANRFWFNLKTRSWQHYLWNFIEFGLVLMLFGAYAGRRKIFTDVSNNRNFLRKVMFWGLLVGGIGIAIDAGTQWSRWENLYLRDAIGIFINYHILFLSFGYVAALTLLVQNNKWKNRLSFFAPVGQMGLTSYILHTIALTVVFEQFALGLLGKVGQFYGLLLAIGVFVLIYFFSRWWLKYFKHGPFEWLWRSLTYLKFQPMRLKKGGLD